MKTGKDIIRGKNQDINKSKLKSTWKQFRKFSTNQKFQDKINNAIVTILQFYSQKPNQLTSFHNSPNEGVAKVNRSTQTKI